MLKTFRQFLISSFMLASLFLLAACSTPQYSNSSAEASESQATVSSSPPPPVVTGSVNSQSRSERSTALGTQWGEGISSHVTSVDLKRISETVLDQLEIRYSASQPSGRAVQDLLLANGRVRMSILDNNSRKWPLIRSGNAVYLAGKQGDRYQIQYQNNSDSTYEIVATVDGLDVLTGKAGSVRNRGYVLRPHSTFIIEGFRSSQSEVAAFRFSAPGDAYVANTPAGDVRNTGVIGTAVFELNVPRPVQRPPVRPNGQAFPADNSPYAPPPQYRQ